MRHIVALEGPMGAGKSEAGKQLVKRIPGSVLLPEPVDPQLLQLLYEDPKTWAGPFQVHALHERKRTSDLATALAKAGYLVFMDRSLWGDRAFALTNFRLGNIHPDMMRIYERSVHAIVGSLPPPTLLLYFTVTPETALKRIKSRGRGSEAGVPLEYLQELSKAYDELLRDVDSAAYPWSHALKLHHFQWDMPTATEEGWDNAAASILADIARRPLPDYMNHDVLYPTGTFLDDKPPIIFHEDLHGDVHIDSKGTVTIPNATISKAVDKREAMRAVIKQFAKLHSEKLGPPPPLRERRREQEAFNRIIVRTPGGPTLGEVRSFRILEGEVPDEIFEIGGPDNEVYEEDPDDVEFRREQELLRHLEPLEECEDANGLILTHFDPRNWNKYALCDCCGRIMELEDSHSAGECNLCHAVNKDD